MSRGRLYVAALVLLILAVAMQGYILQSNRGAGHQPQARATEVSAPGERSTAPDVALPLQPGKPAVALSSMKGKVVLLDFWATWCGPCKMSIPELEKLYKKYHNQGLEVIGISVDDTADPVPAVQKELGMTYPVVLANSIPDIHDKFQFSSIPQLFLVDKKGRIANQYEGFDPSLDMEAEVTKYLKE